MTGQVGGGSVVGRPDQDDPHRPAGRLHQDRRLPRLARRQAAAGQGVQDARDGMQSDRAVGPLRLEAEADQRHRVPDEDGPGVGKRGERWSHEDQADELVGADPDGAAAVDLDHLGRGRQLLGAAPGQQRGHLAALVGVAGERLQGSAAPGDHYRGIQLLGQDAAHGLDGLGRSVEQGLRQQHLGLAQPEKLGTPVRQLVGERLKLRCRLAVAVGDEGGLDGDAGHPGDARAEVDILVRVLRRLGGVAVERAEDPAAGDDREVGDGPEALNAPALREHVEVGPFGQISNDHRLA